MFLGSPQQNNTSLPEEAIAFVAVRKDAQKNFAGLSKLSELKMVDADPKVHRVWANLTVDDEDEQQQRKRGRHSWQGKTIGRIIDQSEPVSLFIDSDDERVDEGMECEGIRVGINATTAHDNITRMVPQLGPRIEDFLSSFDDGDMYVKNS